MGHAQPHLDGIEARRAQWQRELPDVDTVGMAVLGRARQVTLRVRPAIEAVFARHGVDTGEFDVLATLLRSGHPYIMRPTELFRSLMVSSGGLTSRLARLEKAGLIERRPSVNDARSLLVQLTRKGKQLATAAFREDMALERLLLAAMSEDELAVLASLLGKLAKSLEDR